MAMLRDNTEWHEQRQCRDKSDREMMPMPPPQGSHKMRAVAEEICGGCPVIAQCKAEAIRRPTYGIWGGEWYSMADFARGGKNRMRMRVTPQER